MNIISILEGIQPLDQRMMALACQYQDNLIKPIGSLGRLEALAVQLSGICGKLHPVIEKRAILIMCADNGVYEENVSTAPQSVTKTQTLNFFKGITGVSVLAKQAGIDLKIVDIGINAEITHPDLIQKKFAFGTKNCAKGAAMTMQEAEKAFLIGFELVQAAKEEGYDILGTGEMGISNTTTAESVIISLCGCSVEDAVGKGAGLTPALFAHKKEIVKQILEVNHPNPQNPLEVLQKVGGFDMAGLAGVFAGAAYFRLPVVVDGIISIAAALAACKMNPLIKDFLLASHCSKEKGYLAAAKEIGLQPYFDLEMRLGEGCGCPFTFYLAQAATALTNHMATFEEGNVDKKDYIDIRGEEA